MRCADLDYLALSDRPQDVLWLSVWPTLILVLDDPLYIKFVAKMSISFQLSSSYEC